MDLLEQANFGLLGIVAAYVVAAVVLLSLNVRSRWRWWIKAGGIVVTTLFFVQAYAAVTALVGWPSRDRLPARFQLHWAKIVEPDEETRNPGAIFMWVEPLDANNVPIGKPRNHALPFSKQLAERLTQAQEQIREGKEVAGAAEMAEEGEEAEQTERDQEENAQMREGQHPGGDTADNFATDLLDITFQDMPDIVQPEKNPF